MADIDVACRDPRNRLVPVTCVDNGGVDEDGRGTEGRAFSPVVSGFEV